MNRKGFLRIKELGLARATLVYLFLVLSAVVIIVPLLFMYNSSLRTTRDLFTAPLALATDPQFSNYTDILIGQNFLLFLGNSIVITTGAMILNLLLSTSAAYALARYKFKISGPLYAFFLLGLMVPLRLASLPLFLLMRDIGILDTRFSLILVYAAWRFGFSILIFFGFFFALPDNIENAGRIDGANEYQLFGRVMLPLAKPGLVIAIIYNAVPIWNDFFFPLIFLRSEKLHPLPLAVATFFGEHSVQWGQLFAFLGLSILPIVLLYLVLSRYFIAGMLAGTFR
ncbi:carbohydrate ABC transporter permease [Marispirochaeta sp.]|jgi:raffinose/stachyose/melibiose transport system permease protein|uniref:carbohydrate ABC transporter permease n=1 Tax=Marispirochaeta sp. TaxID=2038653 RepID=UPI0029C7C697|nr:carbohydrate ABC transporter permease [Marispirochaeta sp.]